MTDTALIITSISGPSPILRTWARDASGRGFPFVLIGDVPSPADFSLPGCDFWSLARQEGLPLRLARLQ